MWQNFLSGILGILLILIIFLGFPPTFKKIITAAFGAVITVLSFWSASKNSRMEETKITAKAESPDSVNN